jgi:putative ABC transport system substrate-binding protein
MRVATSSSTRRLCGAAAWPVAVRAQRPDAVKRIGWLRSGAANDRQIEAVNAAFLQELQKLGWTVGRNLQIDSRVSAFYMRLRADAAEIVGKAPDVLLTNGTTITAMYKQETSTIPIVFVNVADPVASDFAASFARPGGNITGFTSLEYSFAGKWLSILKNIAPSITRVMVLFNPENPNWTGYLPVIEAGARLLRVDVSAARVAHADEIARAIETFARQPASGMIVLPSGTSRYELIVAQAARHRLPAIYPYHYFAEGGGLVSYGSDTLDLYRRAAGYVDRILRGEKPADLPVQAPTKFVLVINLKTAKALGLTIPETLLATADEVIQ